MISTSSRTLWVDQMRGICMMAILLFHTEAYYNDGREIIPYNFYVANVLVAFFFLSGYLFHSDITTFIFSRKMRSIIRRIIFPYFSFTLLLALPKAAMTDYSLQEVITRILEGKGSWFIATLAIAEIEFACAMLIRRTWLFHLLPWIALVGAYLLTGHLNNEYNYWKIHNSLIAYFFVYIGYMYRQYEHRLRMLSKPLVTLLCLLLLVIIKIYVQRTHQSWVIDGVEVTCYPLFIVDMLLGICLLKNLISPLPRIPFIQYTGMHSLTYYFFCGAVPMAVTRLLHHFSFYYEGQYWHIIVAFALVYIISTVIAWLFSNYFVFLHKITAWRRR